MRLALAHMPEDKSCTLLCNATYTAERTKQCSTDRTRCSPKVDWEVEQAVKLAWEVQEQTRWETPLKPLL